MSLPNAESETQADGYSAAAADIPPARQPEQAPPAAPRDTHGWLSALADLAPKLKEAELRVMLELSRRQEDSPEGVRASTRDLSNTIGCGRPNVQKALASLTKRNLVRSLAGSAIQAAGYRVNVFDTIQMGGYATKPPPAQGWLSYVATPTPGVAILRSQGGYDTLPPPTDSTALAAAAAGLDFDPATLGLIDRVLSAKAKNVDADDLAHFRRRIGSHYAKFGRDHNGRPLQHPLPPSDEIVAQFLAIGTPGRMETMLDALMLEAAEADATNKGTDAMRPYNYAWFITVGLSRVHGIHFQQTKRARAILKEVKRKPAPPQPEQIPLPDIAELARKKTMGGGNR
jgi:hypothetical protein